MVTFKELENAKIGETVLLDGKVKRIFLGFNFSKTRIITERPNTEYISIWKECDIKTWSIERPEPKPIGFLAICLKDFSESGRDFNKGSPHIVFEGYRKDSFKRVTINEKGEIFEVEP